MHDMHTDDHHDHHTAILAAAIARVVTAVATLLVAICLIVFVAWITKSEQNAKLYEADSYVCVSQPFSVQCFERTKP